MAEIIIDDKSYGNVEVPPYKHAQNIYKRVLRAFRKNQLIHLGYLFSRQEQKNLHTYKKGGAEDEIELLQMYIDLGEKLNFKHQDAIKLKSTIEKTTDLAHTNLNITKRLTLINKKQLSKNVESTYLFWDIENYSNVTQMFNQVILEYEIEDEHIYIAANPDSLYLKKREWDAELYDFGKTLNSFNFTKCDHGKNVADTILLDEFKKLNIKNSNVFMMTYDRELKELFLDACHLSNNMFILSK